MAVPDIISPSYFTAEAAVVLGCFEQGIHAEVELISPVEKTYAALRDGEIEIVAGSAHSALSAFPRWQSVKLLCAQSQGMYWFLVMRADIGASRGDVSCVKGRKIGAAPWAPLTLVTAIPLETHLAPHRLMRDSPQYRDSQPNHPRLSDSVVLEAMSCSRSSRPEAR